MNIGIIVYSKTGHTLSLVNKLKDKLDSLGHDTTLAKLGTSEPDISKYEGLVIGTPVHGGSPAEAVKDYLEKLPSLEDKKVVCLATSFFPAALGRNQTLKYLKEKCEEKGAEVCGSGGISSLSFGKKKKTEELVEKLSFCFPA
ncbi:MAG: flavodoxin/nitric oxide synthase [Kosmotoga sp.]|nr:MAG: flavodoxin/nitric oxide synthase [Kosmotoga sp.]